MSNSIGNSKPTNLILNNEIQLSYKENNLTFNYTVPEYDKYVNAEYQYKLEGLNDEWSEWSFNSQVAFKNLPAGEYTFNVRAKIANSITDNVAVFSFEICKPWYLNNLAKFIYFILFIILGYYVHKLYTEYHEKNIKNYC